MTMRAVVERPIVEGVDAYGQPLPEKLEVVDRCLPCYAWVAIERTERQDNDSYASIGAVRIIAARDSGISENYVISEITDRRGRVVFAGNLRVQSVARRPDHLVLVARDTAGGRPSG